MQFIISLLVILILDEPEVMDIESDHEHSVSLSDHAVSHTRLLSDIYTEGYSVVFPV